VRKYPRVRIRKDDFAAVLRIRSIFGRIRILKIRIGSGYGSGENFPDPTGSGSGSATLLCRTAYWYFVCFRRPWRSRCVWADALTSFARPACVPTPGVASAPPPAAASPPPPKTPYRTTPFTRLSRVSSPSGSCCAETRWATTGSYTHGVGLRTYESYEPTYRCMSLKNLFKGTVSRELRPMLLYIIGKLFSRPIVASLKIFILLKGQFAMYIKQFSVS